MAILNQGIYKILRNSGSIAAFYDDIVYWEIATQRNKFFVTFMRGVHGWPNNGQESIGTMEINYPHYSSSGHIESTSSFSVGGNRVSAQYDAFLDNWEVDNGPSSHQYNGPITVTELRGDRYFRSTLTASSYAVNTYHYEQYFDTGPVETQRTYSCSYFYPFSSHQLSVLRIEPTVILDLDKESELYDGLGEKGFVVVPEQTHQNVKDNLNYYLEKAGLVNKTTKYKVSKRPNQSKGTRKRGDGRSPDRRMPDNDAY